MNQHLAALLSAALAAFICMAAPAASGDPEGSAQAKAKLAAVRARIAELTNRMGSQLAQRDSLTARVRETELAIAGRRQRVEDLRVAQAATEAKRAELRVEEERNQAALQSQRASLANQARAAYMIGRQEELKLLLNQNNPASLGRTMTYYGYFAEQRSRRIKLIQEDETRLQQLVAQIEQQTQNLKKLEDDANKEIAG